jgi:hypothetical protein
MRCPFCKGDVDIVDGSVDDAVFGRVRCPHPKCARDVVLAILPLEESELLDARSARDAAWRTGTTQPSYFVTSFIVCGLAVCAVMAVAGSLPDWVLLPIAGLSLAGMAIAPFLIDHVIGTRRWLKSLPQRNAKLIAKKEGYRA